jgi:hypothetical protein
MVLSISKQGLATALRTARPGVGLGRSWPLVSAFVLTRTRSLTFIGKEFRQLSLGHPLRGASLADAIAVALKLGRVEGRSRPYSGCERGTAANRPCRQKPSPPAAAVRHLIATSRRCRHPRRCGGPPTAAEPPRRRAGRADAPGGPARLHQSAVPRRAAGTILRSRHPSWERCRA